MNIIKKVALGIGIGSLLVLATKASEAKFTVYFYDLRFLYVNHPFMGLNPGKGKTQKKAHETIIKSINKAQVTVAEKKKAVVTAWVSDLEDLSPLLDVTNEVYDEMIKGQDAIKSK